VRLKRLPGLIVLLGAAVALKSKVKVADAGLYSVELHAIPGLVLLLG